MTQQVEESSPRRIDSTEAEYSNAEWQAAKRATVKIIGLTEEQKEFILVNCWNKAAQFNKRARGLFITFKYLRTGAVTLGALTPVVAAIAASSSTHFQLEYVVLVLTGISGILTGLLGFGRYNERWIHYRKVTEQQRQIGWTYVFLTGDFDQFQDHNQAFPSFIAKLNCLSEHALSANTIAYSTHDAGSSAPDHPPEAMIATKTGILPESAHGNGSDSLAHQKTSKPRS